MTRGGGGTGGGVRGGLGFGDELQSRALRREATAKVLYERSRPAASDAFNASRSATSSCSPSPPRGAVLARGMSDVAALNNLSPPGRLAASLILSDKLSVGGRQEYEHGDWDDEVEGKGGLLLRSGGRTDGAKEGGINVRIAEDRNWLGEVRREPDSDEEGSEDIEDGLVVTDDDWIEEERGGDGEKGSEGVSQKGERSIGRDKLRANDGEGELKGEGERKRGIQAGDDHFSEEEGEGEAEEDDLMRRRISDDGRSRTFPHIHRSKDKEVGGAGGGVDKSPELEGVGDLGETMGGRRRGESLSAGRKPQHYSGTSNEEQQDRSSSGYHGEVECVYHDGRAEPSVSEGSLTSPLMLLEVGGFHSSLHSSHESSNQHSSQQQQQQRPLQQRHHHHQQQSLPQQQTLQHQQSLPQQQSLQQQHQTQPRPMRGGQLAGARGLSPSQRQVSLPASAGGWERQHGEGGGAGVGGERRSGSSGRASYLPGSCSNSRASDVRACGGACNSGGAHASCHHGGSSSSSRGMSTANSTGSNSKSNSSSSKTASSNSSSSGLTCLRSTDKGLGVLKSPIGKGASADGKLWVQSDTATSPKPCVALSRQQGSPAAGFLLGRAKTTDRMSPCQQSPAQGRGQGQDGARNLPGGLAVGPGVTKRAMLSERPMADLRSAHADVNHGTRWQRADDSSVVAVKNGVESVSVSYFRGYDSRSNSTGGGGERETIGGGMRVKSRLGGTEGVPGGASTAGSAGAGERYQASPLSPKPRGDLPEGIQGCEPTAIRRGNNNGGMSAVTGQASTSTVTMQQGRVHRGAVTATSPRRNSSSQRDKLLLMIQEAPSAGQVPQALPPQVGAMKQAAGEPSSPQGHVHEHQCSPLKPRGSESPLSAGSSHSARSSPGNLLKPLVPHPPARPRSPSSITRKWLLQGGEGHTPHRFGFRSKSLGGGASEVDDDSSECSQDSSATTPSGL